MSRYYIKYTCEWCGSTYPRGTFTYWKIIVFEEEHIICDDCKNRLRKVRNN